MPITQKGLINCGIDAKLKVITDFLSKQKVPFAFIIQLDGIPNYLGSYNLEGASARIELMTDLFHDGSTLDEELRNKKENK